MANETVTTIVHRFNFDRYEVHVLYVEYPGGGECWEWAVLVDGDIKAKSDDGIGQSAVAASAAFRWIADEG